jgi:transposase
MTRSWRPTRCTRTRGKKGVPHTDPLDPPRRRANKAPGHGTWDSDRPPVCGVVGRASGRVRLSVERHSDSTTLNEVVRDACEVPAVVNTDDWRGYDRMAETGHPWAVVRYAAGEWARDDDGDGVREVHNNTQEGLWAGLRNFLRTFRGVNKNDLVRVRDGRPADGPGHRRRGVQPELAGDRDRSRDRGQQRARPVRHPDLYSVRPGLAQIGGGCASA